MRILLYNIRQLLSEKIIFPYCEQIVKRFLRKRRFHEFMLRKEGQKWIDFLRESSNPFEKFCIIPDYIGDDAKKRFSHIYQENAWGSSESRSGPGSSMKETEQVRLLLPPLLKKYGIKTLIDVPCGDWNWMKMIDLSGAGVERYIGGDIVPEIVVANEKAFGNTRREFSVIDLKETPLPRGDLLLCRECLVHLPYDIINTFLRNLHQSEIRYLLTTTYTNQMSNSNIKVGDWRPLNLELPPFCFPKPLAILVENSAKNAKGTDIGKSLGLWQVVSLPKSLSQK